MKLWGGRFIKGTSEGVDDFHSSIGFDQRLYAQDIAGSMAHAAMLGAQGIIEQADAEAIIAGLEGIRADIEAGNIEFDVAAEDIHMNIETILIERIGEAGKRLHTGRSRNDQVALDARMYVKDAAQDIRAELAALLRVLLDAAKEHLHTVMPGYTHLQKAQPITLAHHIIAYVQMFFRDADRFAECFARADSMPLGSGALAGTTYALDREAVAKELGFSAITENSLDGVSDRDFVIDFIYAASMTMMHLSRFCEEIILWSSNEFGFVRLDDGYSTGSSIMPQKKNPDMAELIRGKTGRVYGDLMGTLTMMKGLPLAYNKDMQEDKEALFDAYDNVKKCLSVFTGMFATAVFNKGALKKGALQGFTNATDAADYLVKKGLPFREAHEVVGKLVLSCEQRGKALLDLPLEELKTFSFLFEEDVFDAISLETCVAQRNLPGGPAPEAVQKSIGSAEKRLAILEEN